MADHAASHGRELDAAQDLGASPWVAFWTVTVPLSKAGIIAGSMLVFIPCVGELVIPELLGGPETLMIGRVLWDVIPSVPGSSFETQTRKAAAERRELVYEAYNPSLDAWFEERRVECVRVHDSFPQ